MDRRRGEDAGSGVLECRLPFGNESRLKNPSRTQWRRIFFASAFAATAPISSAATALTATFLCRTFASPQAFAWLSLPAAAFVLSPRFSPSDKAPLIRPGPRPAPRPSPCAPTLALCSDPRPVPRPSTHSDLPRCRCENARSRHPSGCRLLAYDASPATVRPDRYSTTSLPE